MLGNTAKAGAQETRPGRAWGRAPPHGTWRPRAGANQAGAQGQRRLNDTPAVFSVAQAGRPGGSGPALFLRAAQSAAGLTVQGGMHREVPGMVG